MKIAIVWFRRDLRITDNPALHYALKENDAIIPVFILDKNILKAPDTGIPRVAYLLQALHSLKSNLEHLNSYLHINHGSPEKLLPELASKTKTSAIYWNRDYEPYALKRDKNIHQLFEKDNRIVKTYEDQLIQAPENILKNDGTPFKVFTPYSKYWHKNEIPKPFAKPLKIHSPPAETIHSVSMPMSIPTLDDLGLRLDIPMIASGEKQAHLALKKFINHNITRYNSERNLPFLDSTSRLSPHLRFGTISPRSILATAQKILLENPHHQIEVSTFITEIIWRDFYKYILFHFPHVAERSFQPQYENIQWENNEDLFQAWCEGNTGYPIVDAAMRQLNQTGWMHNRLRMIVASFLTKDLLIDWKKGEKYFMLKLFDGDLSANNGGWQWAAGTGTDAQPYFRIFNPTNQAKKFDPDGRFIEKFIPEVNTLDYQLPIVNHADQRIKALALYKKAKEA